jgi:hypothetical protein
LRVLVVVAVAITLQQPEWREVFEPETRPTLVVLHDVSRSMETRDVIDPASAAAEPRTRNEVAQPFTEPALWQTLAQRMEVVIEPFSSALDPAPEGTDLDRALSEAAEKHPRLQAVVLVSDGDWNTGDAPARACDRGCG